eukprot:CAMPEP_0181046492 /NCGR_PEP_ID=MMETSP1070-20121207/14379_1 /TAXON_ID=265543 /ORGANISM="Minutocellus polymorphus, Strain NH13" /LENGTH=350 /DNA_ID=CAMNT_0023125109 /DNA_START=527 /DNA_END=1575 /DNA_ORIENTATION=-
MTRPGAGSAIDDFNYVVNSETDVQREERLLRMLGAEPEGVDYLVTTQRDGMEENWRRQIAEWSFQVIDYYNYSRETAGVAISILDRYLSEASINKHKFQCASLSALYIAVKYCEARAPKMESFIILAADRFLPEDVVAMETTILDRIGWKINISLMTAPMTFVRAMLSYLNSSEETMQQLLQSVQYLVELASCDYFFCSHRPSDTALGSILCALDRDGSNVIAIPDVDRSAWSSELKDRFNLGLDEASSSVQDCKRRVGRLYDKVRVKPSCSGNDRGGTSIGSQAGSGCGSSSGRQSPSHDKKDGRRKPSPTGVDDDVSDTAGLVSTASINDKEKGSSGPSPNDRPRKRS